MYLSQSQQTTSFLALSSDGTHGRLGEAQYRTDLDSPFIGNQSSEEALEQFRRTPFFASWDPAVLKIYVECGLTDDGRGGVRLKTLGIHEAVVFAHRRTSFDVYARLKELDPKVALRWIMPGDLSTR